MYAWSTSLKVPHRSKALELGSGLVWTLEQKQEPMSSAVAAALAGGLHASAQSSPRLTKFSLHGPKSVKVEFSDGCVFILSAEFLRIYSPAADSKIRSVGCEKVIFGRRHVGIMSAVPVGNYGIRIVFDDLHRTGIYTWDYFNQLGVDKFTLMRNYIKTLKKHGLSRDPQRRKLNDDGAKEGK